MLVNISEIIAGNKSNHLVFWLNISFVTNYRVAFRLIVAIAIDLLTSEDRYFFWITAVPLPRGCLQSWQYSGAYMRGVTLAQSGPPNLRPYLILLLFHQPITSPKLYSPSVRYQPHDCAMTWAFQVLRNICYRKISWEFISTFGRNVTLSLEYLGPAMVFQ